MEGLRITTKISGRITVLVVKIRTGIFQNTKKEQ
jgi:hypothetical protein